MLNMNGYLKSQHSSQELRMSTVVMSLIEEAQSIENETGFIALMRGHVKTLIPHEMAVCGIGERGGQSSERYINIGFPINYLKAIITKDRAIESPVAKAWAEKPEAQIFNDLAPLKKQNAQWANAIEKYGIRNMLVNGLPDIAGGHSSYFCLAQCPVLLTENHRYLMELITPYLHKALLRAIKGVPVKHPPEQKLTPREYGVFQSMRKGNSNKEIAQALNISQNTVRNHVSKICEKLDVANRTEAVAKAKSVVR